MRIAILGENSDLQVQAVSTALGALGAEVLCLSPNCLDGSHGVAVLEGDLLVDTAAFDDVGALWVKQLPLPFHACAGAGPPAESGDRLFELQTQVREKLQLVLSWLCELEDRGTVVVNPARSGAHFIFKPYQLARMRRAGVPVPRTLYTTSPEAALAFRKEVGPCIVKPIAGGAYTRDFDDVEVQDTLELIRKSPVVVQERIFGEHVRVTIVGDEIVSAVVIGSPALDYRTDPDYHSNAHYDEARLSDEGKRIALAAAQASGLTYTGIDILRNGDRHVVLECNTSPIYLDIERRMGHAISQGIAAYLVACAKQKNG